MIKWGIIGCGDVTERKSGPAFNKVPDSKLMAVMRRDEAKVRDYAQRHQVPMWYTDAQALINDPEVNAIYIATPPSSHEAYTISALEAGKPVYVEKPMALSHASALRMAKRAKELDVKLAVAHYRRAQPLFRKISEILEGRHLGDIHEVQLEFRKTAMSEDQLMDPRTAWRIDPTISGGGLFHDLAPHQLDILYHLFGQPLQVTGNSYNLGRRYQADDTVEATLHFPGDIRLEAAWDFNALPGIDIDTCEIQGERGKIAFSFFQQQDLLLTVDGKVQAISFAPLQHVQQPMIEAVVTFFNNKGPNPCSGDEGAIVMGLIDSIVRK